MERRRRRGADEDFSKQNNNTARQHKDTDNVERWAAQGSK